MSHAPHTQHLELQQETGGGPGVKACWLYLSIWIRRHAYLSNGVLKYSKNWSGKLNSNRGLPVHCIATLEMSTRGPRVEVDHVSST